MQTIKPGYLTTEFALIVAAMLVSLLVAIGLPARLGMSSSTLQTQIAAALVGVLPVAYASLRTWLKARFNVALPVTVPTMAAPLQAMPMTALVSEPTPTQVIAKIDATQTFSPAA